VDVIGLLVNEKSSQGQGQIRDVQEAAQTLGQRLIVLNGSSDENITVAFSNLAQKRIGALIIGADPFFDPKRGRLVALVAQHAIPAIYINFVATRCPPEL
jgi:DNA-binding LacI/PurR family transcriptional regulator